jgi:hypothetical protein
MTPVPVPQFGETVILMISLDILGVTIEREEFLLLYPLISCLEW